MSGGCSATPRRMARILLDQNVPVGLRRTLTDHDVKTVYQHGWAGLSNGDLLDRASQAGIEVFITCDQNIPSQQNVAARQIAVIVLTTNRWAVIRARPDAVRRAVAQATPGTCFDRDASASQRERL